MFLILKEDGLERWNWPSKRKWAVFIFIIKYRWSYVGTVRSIFLYVPISNFSIRIRFSGFKFISYSPTDICKLTDLTKWARLTLFQNWNAGLISKILKTSILATKINKSFSMKYNSHEFRDNIIFIQLQQTLRGEVPCIRCRLLYLALLHI